MHCLAILRPFLRQSRTFLWSLVGLPSVALLAPDQKRWLTARTPRHWSGFLRRLAAARAHWDLSGAWFSSRVQVLPPDRPDRDSPEKQVICWNVAMMRVMA